MNTPLLATSLFALGLLGAVMPAHAAPPVAPAISTVQISHDQYLAHSEPSAAQNPRHHRNIVAGSKMFTDPAHYVFKIGTYYTKDGGATWHDSGLLPGFENYDITSDVSFAYAANGTVYACVLAESGKKSGIFVSKSTNGGATWSNPSTVFLDVSGGTFSDKPWIAVDRSFTTTRGTIYVVWNLDSGSSAKNHDRDGGKLSAAPARGGLRPRQSSPSLTGMVASRSLDGGKTWSAPTVFQPFTRNAFPLGAIPQVGPDGTLYVAYSSISNATGLVNSLDLVTSHDGGATFSAPRTVVADVAGLPNHLRNGTFRNLSLPAFAVSPSNGTLLLAWADMRYGESDILASRSTDGGTTWSAPIKVNHDATGSGRDHFQPSLAVAPNGAFAISWFDRRHDPLDRLIDVEAAVSTDDGASFGRNVRVTRKSWDPTIDAPQPEGKPTNTFIGDYQGLTADNAAIHPVWNDTANLKSQEIESATISFRIFARR